MLAIARPIINNLITFITVEYDAVSRLGVNDPTKFIKQRYKSHDLVMLSSCCLATSVINEVEGCVQEEVRRAEKWVDILVRGVATEKGQMFIINFYYNY